MAMLALAGCSTLKVGDTVSGPGYKVTNFHRSSDRLPVSLRRVALLPLAARGPGANASAADALGPVLAGELLARHELDLAQVSPDDLARWTGRPDWSAGDKLPAGFLNTIQGKTAADAVLFSEVTAYRPYPPLAVGLKLTLVDVQSGRVLWAVDDLLDAGQPAVADGARRFHLEKMRGAGEQPFDSHSILDSPRRFARYAAATLLDTMPQR
jgi:hypothetical protein